MTRFSRGAIGLLMLCLSTSALAVIDGSAPVPEPGTLGLLAVGIAAVALTRLRGRK